MITGGDLYNVLAAVVPLYVAMFVAYGSVRWWNIFTPDQCSGINRFVAIFAVPLLSFVFISENNPFAMNFHFLAADSLAKLLVLIVLGIWLRLSRHGSLDWVITLFSLSTLPNTLVMGIPLLRAMYGDFSGNLMVQIVVLQCIIWYTLLLFLFEYRAAKNLISDQFPDTAASIVSFRVESDVLSLDGGPEALIQTDADVGPDGKLHVTVRKSTSSRGGGMSSKALTPRPSNMTGFEIYSMHSSRNPTPRGSSFNHSEFYSTRPVSPSKGVATPRGSNFDEEAMFPKPGGLPGSNLASPRYNHPPPPVYSPANYTYGPRSNINSVDVNSAGNTAPPANGFHHGRMLPPSPTAQRLSKMPMGMDPKPATSPKFRSAAADTDSKELHMFVWNSSASPVSKLENGDAKLSGAVREEPLRDDFSFGNRESLEKEGPSLTKIGSSSTAELAPKSKEMPPATVLTKLILVMVWRKLIRNPNTYSSLLGLIWSLVASRWNLTMPTILKGSVTILSNAGLGMAMFSLGLFMAMQPRLIACGNTVAAFSMAVKFLTGPAVMAAASIAIGIRGTLLHVAIVQAALPQGIVPFVFAKEYNVHPDILSTGVIFGMLVALPVTLLYYFLLGL